MAKSDRLHALHQLLQHSRFSTPLSTILAELDCTKATFMRLRRDLESMYHREIVYDRGGYRYAEAGDEFGDFPGLRFSRAELEALVCLEQAVNTIQDGILSPVVEPFRKKMLALLSDNEIDRGEWQSRIKVLPYGKRRVDEKALKGVASAVLHRKRLCVTYRSLHADTIKTREISPQTLLLYRDNWYVDGFCHERGDLRTFALSRLKKVRVLDKTAKPVSRRALDRFYSSSYGIFCGLPRATAVIRFTGVAAREMSNEMWHPKQKICHIDPYTIELRIPYGADTELIMDILRWGDEAQVLQPPELREKVRAKVEKMLGLYSPVA